MGSWELNIALWRGGWVGSQRLFTTGWGIVWELNIKLRRLLGGLMGVKYCTPEVVGWAHRDCLP